MQLILQIPNLTFCINFLSVRKQNRKRGEDNGIKYYSRALYIDFFYIFLGIAKKKKLNIDRIKYIYFYFMAEIKLSLLNFSSQIAWSVFT